MILVLPSPFVPKSHHQQCSLLIVQQNLEGYYGGKGGWCIYIKRGGGGGDSESEGMICILAGCGVGKNGEDRSSGVSLCILVVNSLCVFFKYKCST